MNETIVLCSRVPWARVEQALSAFQAARREASKSPLRELFRSSALDGIEVARKRRFGWFGASRVEFQRASTFLVAAIEQSTIEAVDLADAPIRVLAAIADDPSKAGARAKLAELFAADHGLPEWMRGEAGPSLVSPDEVIELREALESVGAAFDEPARTLLGGVLSRCEAGQGLLIEL